jgi:transglutaminase-like putative cysteine protease
MKNLPEDFYQKCLPKNKNINLEKFLRKIDLVFQKNLGNKGRNAKSFEESRFLTAKEILKKKINSCGAKTTIFAGVLRKIGIPTKLVHGKFKNQKGADRHAWLKIYNPLNKKWLDVDITQKDFSLPSQVVLIREYHDWNELKIDYRKGNW